MFSVTRRVGADNEVQYGGRQRVAAVQAVFHGPGRDRTCDLGIKSPLLYQLSYRPRS
jgi:hypothetical protein